MLLFLLLSPIRCKFQRPLWRIFTGFAKGDQNLNKQIRAQIHHIWFLDLHCHGEVHQEQFGQCTEPSSACVGWVLDTITVGHVAAAFTPHSHATKHKSRPQRAASRAKENCIVFQSMLAALRGLPATGTLLIKRRQTAGAVGWGFLTTGEEERGGGRQMETEGGDGGERADDKILACVPAEICVRCTNQLHSHNWMNLFCEQPLASPACLICVKNMQDSQIWAAKCWGFHFKGTVLTRAIIARRGLDPYMCVLPSCGHCALSVKHTTCGSQTEACCRCLCRAAIRAKLSPSNQETCVVLCVCMCVCSIHHMSLKTFHHRKFLHVEAPLLCSVSNFSFAHWHFTR